MYDSDESSSRRALLGTAAGSLAALAGCTSALPSMGGSSNDGGDTPSGSDSNDGASSGTSLLYASDETTKFDVDLEGNPLMGSADAPLDVYYWTDYQCPFCKKFEQNTLPKLVDDYIEPGKLRMVVMENPYIGQASETAARMSKCVWRTVRDENPDAFKRWHATIFDEQGKENSGWAKEKNLLEITRGVSGVDAGAVESCMNEETKAVKASVDADVQAAKSNDIRGTPAFIFFDRESEKAGKIVGAQPYSLFEKAIRKVDNA
ncbi:DsbA family protein [Halomicrococcus sp. NG-SE-24]|uniref:DsbA family protein n=1 Tax=Halomicrococcus sp. NG-SE-24 TaxID=3436928 RepID=UPI003D97FC46